MPRVVISLITCELPAKALCYQKSLSVHALYEDFFPSHVRIHKIGSSVVNKQLLFRFAREENKGILEIFFRLRRYVISVSCTSSTKDSFN